MRAILLCLLFVACAGPGQSQLAETPTATTPRAPSLAPPASGSDKERHQLNQQFEDMRDANEAHREAQGGEAPPPPPPNRTAPPSDTAPPGATPPRKRGPAEQAPAPQPTK